MTFTASSPPGRSVNVFSAEHWPALTIDPGDTVKVRSLDAAGT